MQATMNCTQCQDSLVHCAEGLLDDPEALQCHAHLDICDHCRSEYRAITSLQQQLISHGQDAAAVAIVGPVMDRVLREPREAEKVTLLSLLLRSRWGFGLGAAVLATVLLLIAFVTMPGIPAAAADVLGKGAEAVARITSIHIRSRLRTLPADNFSFIAPDQDFVPVELWEQYQPALKWRAEKPGRIAVMDGKSTMLYIKPDEAVKFPQPSRSAFDTEWLHEIANISQTLHNELGAIKLHHWPVTLTHDTTADGKPESIVSIEAKSGLLTGDYLKNKFFDTADTRRVYVFDDQTNLLTAVRIYLHAPSGNKLIFELDQIDYNQTMAPGIFELQLPTNVSWAGQMPILPDNDKYASMTSEEAARAMFEACGREDWTEAAKFFNPLTGRMKEKLGGLQLISIGAHFTSAISLINGDQFVPYEIKLKDGSVRKFNLALRRDADSGRWYVDGGI